MTAATVIYDIRRLQMNNAMCELTFERMISGRNVLSKSPDTVNTPAINS